jgi:hypothetical protein
MGTADPDPRIRKPGQGPERGIGAQSRRTTRGPKRADDQPSAGASAGTPQIFG